MPGLAAQVTCVDGPSKQHKWAGEEDLVRQFTMQVGGEEDRVYDVAYDTKISLLKLTTFNSDSNSQLNMRFQCLFQNCVQVRY